MDATLRIHIGLSVDASADRLFEPIEKAAKRASQSVKSSMSNAASGGSQLTEQARREQEVFKATHELQMTLLKQRMSTNRTALAQEAATKRQEIALTQKTAAQTKQIEANLNQQREAIRAKELAQQEKANAASALIAQRHAAKMAEIMQREANAQGKAQASGSTIGGSIAKATTKSAHELAGYVRQGAGLVMQSGGMAVDPSALFQRNIELEKRAVDLSNAGYMPGAEGAAGKRQAPSSILSRVRGAAEASALDSLDTMEGVQTIVGMTGDLEGAIKLVERLGPLARASGTSVKDMAGMAGQDAKFLDDMSPDKKTDAVEALMRTFVAQGKTGTVESKDLAKYSGKFIAQAGSFKGDFQQNAATLGALAQLSMKGGASTAAEAANSVAGLANTLKTPARLKKFREAGVDVYDKETGQLNSVESILTQSLAKTKGDPEAMKKLFANVMGDRAIADLSNTWRKAERNKAGTGNQALHSSLASLAGASMSDDEIKESFAASMNTTEAKAKKFQLELEKSAQELQAKLLPAVERLAPSVIKAADALVKVVDWSSKNPFEAMTVLFGGLVAKNLSADLFRSAISEGVKGAASGAGLGAAGNIAAGVGIAAAAYATYHVGTMIIDSAFANQLNVDKKTENETFSAEALPALIAEKDQEIAQTEQQMSDLENQSGGVMTREQSNEYLKLKIKRDKQVEEREGMYQKAEQYLDNYETRGTDAEARAKGMAGKGVVGDVARGGAEVVEGLLSMVGFTGARSFDQQKQDRADEKSYAEIQNSVNKLNALFSGKVQVHVTNPDEIGAKGRLQAPKGTK